MLPSSAARPRASPRPPSSSSSPGTAVHTPLGTSPRPPAGGALGRGALLGLAPGGGASASSLPTTSLANPPPPITGRDEEGSYTEYVLASTAPGELMFNLARFDRPEFRLANLARPVRLFREDMRPRPPEEAEADQAAADRKKKRPFQKKTISINVKDEKLRQLEKEEASPWTIEDESNNVFDGSLDSLGDLVMLKQEGVFMKVYLLHRSYKFNQRPKYETLTLEEAEEKMKSKGLDRWLMHNRGQAAEVDEKEEKDEWKTKTKSVLSSRFMRLLGGSQRKAAGGEDEDDEEERGRSRKRKGKGRDSENFDRELVRRDGMDYREEFDDDEETPTTADREVLEEEPKERENEEQRSEKRKLARTGKDMAKIMTKFGLYDEDDEEDPYAEEVGIKDEEDEEMIEDEEGATGSAGQNSGTSTPKAAGSATPTIASGSGTTMIPSTLPGTRGSAASQKRPMTKPNKSKLDEGNAPTPFNRVAQLKMQHRGVGGSPSSGTPSRKDQSPTTGALASRGQQQQSQGASKRDSSIPRGNASSSHPAKASAAGASRSTSPGGGPIVGGSVLRSSSIEARRPVAGSPPTSARSSSPANAGSRSQSPPSGLARSQSAANMAGRSISPSSEGQVRSESRKRKAEDSQDGSSKPLPKKPRPALAVPASNQGSPTSSSPPSPQSSASKPAAISPGSGAPTAALTRDDVIQAMRANGGKVKSKELLEILRKRFTLAKDHPNYVALTQILKEVINIQKDNMMHLKPEFA